MYCNVTEFSRGNYLFYLIKRFPFLSQSDCYQEHTNIETPVQDLKCFQFLVAALSIMSS